MSKSKVLDFDRFMEERAKETIDVKVYGKTYKIAKEIPALVPIMMARSEEDENATLSGQMILRAADGWFGKETVDEFCRHGMTTTEISNLVTQLFRAINGTADEEDDDAEEYSDEDSRVTVKSAKPKK